MKTRLSAGLFALLVTIGATAPEGAPDAGKNREPLVEQVRDAIKRGVQFLRDKQVVTDDGKGHWEIDAVSTQFRGGETSLAILALLNAGVPPNDPVIERGLKFLRGVKPDKTYAVGLQTMVLAAAGRSEDLVRISDNAQWLIDARVMEGNNLLGWTYEKRGTGADNSNTQYALLGLHEAHLAGVQIKPEVWESIRAFYQRTQIQERTDRGFGSWVYNGTENTPKLTMTTAGLCGLIISGMELNEGRETIEKDGTARECGKYKDNQNLAIAVDWIGRNFRIEPRRDSYPAVYYNLYGIERAGRLSGRRWLGEHDWYREGCEFLVRRQHADGSWLGEGHDKWPLVSTSFALLFLSKGRTPVLVSKLTHGPGQDWNNDRNDARNLVNFASEALFKKLPLAWQVFNARDVEVRNRDELNSLAGELLQSPVVYFNGHEAPEFTENEKELLKKYVDQGGFILAEACCGKKEFADGFRDLMKQLFPKNDLQPLSPEHPIWRSHFLVQPGAFNLEGIDLGCKTVVVFSPEDLSCQWEAGTTKSRDGKPTFRSSRGQLAFELGANIVAYATGMEPPRPRLTEVKVVSDREDARKIPRGYLKVAQLRHGGDWQPAPQAMRNLMLHLREQFKLDAAMPDRFGVRPESDAVLDFKLLYLHGRAEFKFDDRGLDNLRSDLNTGGLILADACCGKKAFDTAFREFMARLFPGKKLEQIPLNDPLFSKELNGEAITTVRCRRERPDGSGPEAGYREVPPFLEGIRLNNRWVVIYSKYDLGCALEKHQSTDCLGHDYASALKLGTAAILYAMMR